MVKWYQGRSFSYGNHDCEYSCLVWGGLYCPFIITGVGWYMFVILYVVFLFTSRQTVFMVQGPQYTPMPLWTWWFCKCNKDAWGYYQTQYVFKMFYLEINCGHRVGRTPAITLLKSWCKEWKLREKFLKYFFSFSNLRANTNMETYG